MSTETFDHPELPLPILVKRLRNARRLRLRVDHDRQLLRLSIPAHGSARAALRWAGEQRAWVDQQLAIAPASLPFVDGGTTQFEGQPLRLRWVGAGRRSVRVSEGELLVECPSESFAGVVERWLKAEARQRLSLETARVAGFAGVAVRSVSIGDPVSRWGSCSSSGTIRFSWRLILAPPECLRFVVAHEVAHRLHMDHSPAFKQAEERLFGSPVAAVRALLRELGPTLRAVGRN